MDPETNIYGFWTRFYGSGNQFQGSEENVTSLGVGMSIGYGRLDDTN